MRLGPGPVCLVAAVLVVPTLAAAPVPARVEASAGVQATSVMGPGITRMVPFVEGLSVSEADAPAISDDGRLVAYERHAFYGSDAAVPGVLAGTASGIDVAVTNPRTGHTWPVTNAELFAASSPSISGDGSLVAYVGIGSYGHANIYVADRAVPDEPVVRQATGLSGDVRFQRIAACFEETSVADQQPGPCGPVLSGDGRSLAFPATQSVVSPSLFPEVQGDDAEVYLDPGQHALALVGFSFPQEQTERVIVLHVVGPDAVTFRQPTITPELPPAEAPYDLFAPEGETACGGATVQPFQSCAIGVRINQVGCDVPSYAMLDVNSPTAAGQTRIVLVGRQPGCVELNLAPTGPAPAAAATCQDDGPAPRAGESGSPDSGAPDVALNLGEQAVDGTTFHVQEVRNDTDFSAAIRFEANDCALQLVEPAAPGDFAACVPGMTLVSGGSCRAYVRYQPRGVRPSVARLFLDSQAGTRRFLFTGAGRTSVVVMRRDPSGRGDFAGKGSTPARIVSVRGSGAVIRGFAPSLSDDGRYVAFGSGFGPDRPTFTGQPSQVFWHDTDAAGDGTWVPGKTRNVSLVSGETTPVFAGYAVQPSLAGDGNRVAFVELLTEETTNPDVLTKTGSVVWVHDLASGETVRASAPHDPGALNPSSSVRPSLSRDGSTVAFASDSLAMVPDGVEADGPAEIYVRDLGPDFGVGSGLPRVDIVSLAPGDLSAGAGRLPAIDGDGGIVAFSHTNVLTDVDTDFTRQVYTRTRFGTPTVFPDALAFPEQAPGTVGPSQPVFVSDGGPGPVRVSATVSGPYVLTRTCTAVLHRQEQCQLGVAYRPQVSRPHDGTLTVRFSETDWPGRVVRVRLLAPLQIAVTPSRVVFPDQVVGTTSDPVSVRVRNRGTRAIGLVAGILPGDVVPGQTPPALTEDSDDAFTVRNPGQPDAGCSLVLPQATCTLEVTFHPPQPGSRNGWLAIGYQALSCPAEVLCPESLTVTFVRLSGHGAQPEIEVSPTVAREGRVAFVSGTGFLPGQPLELTWSGGPVGLPEVVPDASGQFTAPIVIFEGRPGLQSLTVTMPGIGSVETEVLVVQGSLQPPDFVSRN